MGQIGESLLNAADDLLKEFKRAESIQHTGERGAEREGSLAALFKKYLPARCEVGSGFIEDRQGRISKQQDIIIYDRLSSGLILTGKKTLYIPIELVYATIQVKSSLGKPELLDALENQASVRILESEPGSQAFAPGALAKGKTPPPLCGVLAFRLKVKLKSLARYLIEFNQSIPYQQSTDVICILEPPSLLLFEDAENQGLVQLYPSPNRRLFGGKTDRSVLILLATLENVIAGRITVPPQILNYLPANAFELKDAFGEKVSDTSGKSPTEANT